MQSRQLRIAQAMAWLGTSSARSADEPQKFGRLLQVCIAGGGGVPPFRGDWEEQHPRRFGWTVNRFGVHHYASDVPPPREHRSALHRHIHWGGHNARSGWLGLANVSGSGIAPVGEAEKGVGQRFESEDGRASGVVSMMSNIFSPNARTSFLAYTGSTPRIMPDERYFSMPSAEVGGDARRKMDRHAARA